MCLTSKNINLGSGLAKEEQKLENPKRKVFMKDRESKAMLSKQSKTAKRNSKESIFNSDKKNKTKQMEKGSKEN